MEYDYRNRAGSQSTMYGPPPSSSAAHHPIYGPPQPSFYPKIGQPQGFPARIPPFQHPSSQSSSSGIGIRVAIKPQYRITPPPQLSPQTGDIPRSSFHFDFDLERKILAEAEKETQNWSKLGLENMTSNTLESKPSLGSTPDPVVSKYIASGLNREAVPLAVANYGDNPTKVREFVNGFALLRDMGFSSNSVAEALLMYDNDTDKALAHFLNSSA